MMQDYDSIMLMYVISKIDSVQEWKLAEIK